MPTCAGVLVPRQLALRLLKSAFNVQSFIRWLSRSISSHFVAIHFGMCAANCAKFAKKNPILDAQVRSRSSTLINLKRSSPVLVMISSIYVPICNRFHAIRANSGKITSF